MYTYTIQRSASARQLNNLNRGVYTICHLTRDFFRDFYFRNAESSIATGLIKQWDHGDIVRVRVDIFVDIIAERDVDSRQCKSVDWNERQGAATHGP